MITVDMNKALLIHQNYLRQLRMNKLNQLDIEYMKALETNDIGLQQLIIEKKQALRDVTTHPSVLNAKTPEELKKAIPAILLNN